MAKENRFRTSIILNDNIIITESHNRYNIPEQYIINTDPNTISGYKATAHICESKICTYQSPNKTE